MISKADIAVDDAVLQAMRDLEAEVRSKGNVRLIQVVARLATVVEEMQARASQLEERVALLETALEAISMPAFQRAIHGELPASVMITAEMVLGEGEGFYRLEYTTIGQPYRWTGAGGGEFRFTINIDRSEARTASIAIWPFGGLMSPVPPRLHCVVDAERMTAELVPGQESAVYTMTLPRRSGLEATRLRVAGGTWRPEVGDARDLGVPFRYLLVE